MRHQSLISIKYRYVKLAFTFVGIKKNTLYNKHISASNRQTVPFRLTFWKLSGSWDTYRGETGDWKVIANLVQRYWIQDKKSLKSLLLHHPNRTVLPCYPHVTKDLVVRGKVKISWFLILIISSLIFLYLQSWTKHFIYEMGN